MKNRCRACSKEIGRGGWASHVAIHKRQVQKIIGHLPTWDEVLDFYSPKQKQLVPKQPKLGDFA